MSRKSTDVSTPSSETIDELIEIQEQAEQGLEREPPLGSDNGETEGKPPATTKRPS